MIVLANGCFDVLHYGHLLHLREARSMGDRLIVSLTHDYAVNKGPGRPVNPWDHRAELLRELRCVDDVVGTDTAIRAILSVRPDVFVKGIDYSCGDRWTEEIHEACKQVGARLAFTKSPKMSATDIIRKTMAL